MKIKPLFDRLLVEIKQKNEPTKVGSLILPETNQDKPLIGKIVALGNGIMADNSQVQMQVKLNDTILFNKYAGSEFKDNGKTYVLLRQSEILAIINE